MQQELYLWISPPDPDFILFQPGETIPILDLKAFPASFIDSLAGEIGADGVVRFRVWIYEDAGSPGREIVIESLEQKVIARIGRDWDYSPEWFVRALYPALDTYDEWRRDWLTACYDPARVCMRYDLLVGEDNLIEYVRARSIEAARLAKEREAAAMMRFGEEGGSVSNLQLTAIGTTPNGTIGLTLAWPDEGLSTNVVDIFACTDLCARDWALADTLTLDMQTNRVVWVDAVSTNRVTRFYDAWTHHDSDGDGIPDGREVRLYGTDPHNWDTDGDGLSDSAELFVHGTSALNADSDGDGLPDGWEVHYGLDPLDATGDNGADGDPDGDGFTNLQEFQMGGDPANPAINAAQLIHRLMHCRGGSSLRVDVEDSENCGGTNPNRQEVEDVFSVGPLMHCGYLLSLTVEGRVEDHNSGFDKVSIRSYASTNLQSEVPFFEGHNNGNGCAMIDERAATNVWFWSNGSVRLRYDTGDGLYHTDAYAEITAATLVDVLGLNIKVADPDDSGWGDLEEKKVILSDKNTRIKIRITPHFPDIQTIFTALGTALKVKTSGTAPNGQDYTLTAQNTTLVQGSGYSEMRVSLTRDQLKTLGVLPSQEADSVAEKAWLDHGSSSSSESSNLTDGNAFESGLSNETRGKSTNYGNLESTPPNSPVDKTFFIAAGREVITAQYACGVSHKRQLMNQADHFYYSGHGSHADAILQGGFAPSDVTDYWDKDLDYVIIAGCAVLDIKNYRAQSFGLATWLQWYAAGGDWSPGAQWEPKGPQYFIGYNWTAPLDNQGSAGIVSNFLSTVSGGASFVNAWKQANDLGVGRNACVIDCASIPHVYWYWNETSGTPVWTNVVKSGGTW